MADDNVVRLIRNNLASYKPGKEFQPVEEPKEVNAQEPNVIQYVLYQRLNLGEQATRLREDVFSKTPQMPQFPTTFQGEASAEAYIRANGDKKMLYQIRPQATESLPSGQRWVYDGQRGWHVTMYRQPKSQGFKSDKRKDLARKLRMELCQKK
jgi:hypothetical protein